MSARLRVAILISGRGSNMEALIEAARLPDFPAEIALVLSNVAGAGGLATAKAAGVATGFIDSKIYAGREEFERSVQALFEIHRIELVCLAGFMRVLSPWFVGIWSGRLLNIHPSLLPAFPGLDTHARALAGGCAIHGCTVHQVTMELDAGPIVAQAATAVLPGDTAEALAARVLALEHALYPLALARTARERLGLTPAPRHAGDALIVA